MAADAATNAAGKVRPDEESLAKIDHPAEDNTWHDAPDFSKDNLKKQAQGIYGGNPKDDVKHASNQATSTAHPSGSNDHPKDLANTAARDQQTGGSSGVDARQGASAGANALKERVNANVDDDTKEDARRKADEYKARTREYFQRKVPQERREQIIWRLKVCQH
jgi:DNA ligase-4